LTHLKLQYQEARGRSQRQTLRNLFSCSPFNIFILSPARVHLQIFYIFPIFVQLYRSSA
jgi:hypothetical protein